MRLNFGVVVVVVVVVGGGGGGVCVCVCVCVNSYFARCCGTYPFYIIVMY